MVPAAATTPAANVGPPLDITPRKAKSYWAQGVSAYRSGDLNGALADFNQAIQSDPKFAPAYIDRGILFYRLHKSAHAFADISHAKRLERASRLARARKKPMRAMADNARPLPPRQTAEVDLSQQPSPVVTRP